jgi:hypothetical protein
VLVLVLGGFSSHFTNLLGFTGGNESADMPSNTNGSGGQSTSSGNLLKNIEQAAQTIFNNVTSGSTIKSADFDKQFGQDAADVLREMKVTEISRRGSRLELRRQGRTTEQFNGNSIQLDRTVSFDVIRLQPTLELKNIKGVQVDPGSKLPNLGVREVSAVKDAAGNTTFILKLELSRFLPYITHTIKVSPDGRSLSK